MPAPKGRRIFRLSGQTARAVILNGLHCHPEERSDEGSPAPEILRCRSG